MVLSAEISLVFPILDIKFLYDWINGISLFNWIRYCIKKSRKESLYIFDGDGNILMNLGSLTTIGSLKPKNLVHVVFDNSIHESTGSQPTNTNFVSIEKIAKACNYTIRSQ